MRVVRGMVLIGLVYAILIGMGLVALPTAIVSRRGALWWCKTYARTIFGLMRPVAGISVEIRGEVPRHPCIVAANHQSFLDVLMLVHALPVPRFVMKRSLLWVPVLGYFAKRIGCIAIDRQSRGALGEILDGMEAAGHEGQMIIYPQGTRIPPGVSVPYRSGVVAMQRRTGLPVELVATNAGLFWPGHGVARHPGTAVLSFLGMAPGAKGVALETIRNRVEGAASALIADAR